MTPPTFFFLPGLGLDARAGDLLGESLGPDYDVVGLDLPGFGEAPATGGDVLTAVHYVEAAIAGRAPARWVLVGHSMGGKIASVVAARALAGDSAVFGLAGVVLLAGSPPSPEPMEEERRALMISWAERGGRGLPEADAETFLAATTAAPLTGAAAAIARGGLGRADQAAWRSWLVRGSLEDWSAQVGEVALPALLLAGADDGDLDAFAQRRLNLPHYPRARVQEVPAAAHLLMLEQPDAVADAIRHWWGHRAGLGPTVPEDVARLIASARTSRRTRAAMAGRILADDPDYRPRALGPSQLDTLRAVAARVVPQDGPDHEQIDLAARVDAQLDDGEGDGWRHADAPPDVAAYRRELDALSGLAEDSPGEQERRLRALDDDASVTTTAWWGDVRTDLVRQWLAHPASLARVGYDGFAGGGDEERKQGFVLLEMGTREQWEPTMAPVAEAATTWGAAT